MKKDTVIRWLGGALALSLLLGSCTSRVERAPQDDPAAETPGHQQFVPEGDEAADPEDQSSAPPVQVDVYEVADLVRYDELKIVQPSQEEISVSMEHYYITGVADPDRELLLDGEPVEHRGALGSFGVYVDLEMGQNLFIFSQGSETRSVHIERSEGGTVPTTETMTRMRPEMDVAARAGAPYTLACTAPSGATVTATVGDVTVALDQVAATEFDGVPAAFSGALVPEDVAGTVNLGPVVYTMFFNGETTEYPSRGELYVTGTGHDLIVRSLDAASAVFVEEDDEAGFYSVMPEGVTDVVAEIGGSMYRLAMGGWVMKSAVIPLTEDVDYRSVITGAAHDLVGSREVITLTGTANTPYRAVWDDEEGYAITFYHTSGLEEVPVEESGLLRGIDVAFEDGNTTLSFDPVSGRLWGYLVEYDEGVITITLSRRRGLAEGDRPLAGITVAVDPGHGGNDAGAAGLSRDLGPDEKEINLATAFAVRQKLQELGANVVMLRTEDVRVELDDRARRMRKPDIDFCVSLHCNSIAATADGTKPSGTETYYYDDHNASFTQAVQDAVIARTGRKNRDIKHDYFKVTINSYAPSAMVEMGFLTNPEEYDALCSGAGMQAVADAVGEGIVTYLRTQS